MICVNVPVVIISSSALSEAVAFCQASLLDVNRVFLKFSSNLKLLNILSVPYMAAFLTFFGSGVRYQGGDQSLYRNGSGDHILFGPLNVLSAGLVEVVRIALPLIIITAAVFDAKIVPVAPIVFILILGVAKSVVFFILERLIISSMVSKIIRPQATIPTCT